MDSSICIPGRVRLEPENELSITLYTLQIHHTQTHKYIATNKTKIKKKNSPIQI